MKRLFTAILITLVLAAPAAADVVRTVSTKYYTVQGTTPAAIYAYLQLRSPLKEDGQSYQANTRTDIRYSYQWEKRGNQCTMTKVKVTLHLTYLYPRLANSVDAKTRKWWREVLEKLKEHELIHGEISIKAAHDLNDEIENVRTENCINFKAIVKSRANRIMQKLRRSHATYDRLTEHGMKQERNRGQFP